VGKEVPESMACSGLRAAVIIFWDTPIWASRGLESFISNNLADPVFRINAYPSTGPPWFRCEQLFLLGCRALGSVIPSPAKLLQAGVRPGRRSVGRAPLIAAWVVTRWLPPAQER